MSDTARLEEWLRTVVSEYEYADGDSMAEDAAALLEELHALRTQWAAIPWDAICDELEAARAADVPMLRRMIDGQHKVASERIEEIVRLSSELRDLRTKWESVPWDGLREATQLLRTYEDLIPSASIECLTDDLAEWIEDHAPKEAAEE